MQGIYSNIPAIHYKRNDSLLYFFCAILFVLLGGFLFLYIHCCIVRPCFCYDSNYVLILVSVANNFNLQNIVGLNERGEFKDRSCGGKGSIWLHTDYMPKGTRCHKKSAKDAKWKQYDSRQGTHSLTSITIIVSSVQSNNISNKPFQHNH